MRQLPVLFCALAIAACGPGAGSDDTGDDAPACTTEGATMCEGNSFETCTDGSWTVTDQCPVLCDDDLGCLACQPDQVYCDGDSVMQCASDGSGSTVVETCSGGDHCLGGQCTDLCAAADESNSYIGCEYYAVDLDNAIEVLDPIFLGCDFDYPGTTGTTSVPVCWNGSNSAGLCDENDTCPGGFTCQNPSSEVCLYEAQHSPFAVVVSNPQSFAVNVTISNATGATQTQSVPAGVVQTLFPQNLGFPDASLDRSMKAKNAYKIVADAPIVAYQFNPLDNVGVFSNDASLLIPTTTWDAEYYVMSYPTLPRRPATNDYNGYLTVVASVDGTVIEVTPKVSTRPQGSLAAIAAGTPTQFTLDAYEVLNLEAVAGTSETDPAGDLTGSLVRSLDPTKPIGVFGGHEALVIQQATSPNPAYPNGPCCADHVEEMMFPNSTWGKTFAVARSFQRNGEPDHLRIMAQRASTAVTFDPAPAAVVSGTCGALDAGEFCEVKINADTAITSTEPVLVGHYLESVIWNDGISQSIGSGDPSLAIAVPSEQFRHDYTILVPSQYDANYISIAAPMGGSVAIDGTDATGQMAPFGGDYLGGRVSVTAGQHVITCSDGCGIEVMGYSDAVSYLFAGGLDLNVIVVE